MKQLDLMDQALCDGKYKQIRQGYQAYREVLKDRIELQIKLKNIDLAK